MKSKREPLLSLTGIGKLFDEVHGSIEGHVANITPELRAKIDAAEKRRAAKREARKAKAAARPGRRQLTPAEYDQYYAALGIKDTDLLSPQDVSWDELPADMALSADERFRLGGLVSTWNSADARQKVDMAQAMERAVYKARTPQEAQADACLAYLLLARVRDCEERRALMRRIAIGELTPPAPKVQKRGRPSSAEARDAARRYREQVDARLRAKGLEVVIESSRETTADGDTVTIHHFTTRPLRTAESQR
jgi:hypothetical protein